MYIVKVLTGEIYQIEILPVITDDYKTITKSIFWFDWKQEKSFSVYKLRCKGFYEILGLISLDIIKEESRIEIRLLAVSKDNRGSRKRFKNIAGNLIAYAGIKAVQLFGAMACISLIPKTELITHYKEKYGMLQAGKSLYLDGLELIQLIQKYDYER